MRRGARDPKLFGSSYVVPPRSSNQSRLGKSWRAIIIVIVIGAAVILLGNLPVWRLKTVELLNDRNEIITANSSAPSSNLSLSVAGKLNTLIGRSIFSSAISRLINETRSELQVSDFVCRRGLPATLRCILTERAPEIIWKSDGTEYLVDKHGVLFAIQPTARADLIIVEDTQHQPIKLGSVVASPEIIKQYQRLVDLLKIEQLTVKTLLLNESLYQVTAIIERAGKAPIQGLFLLSGDSNVQVKALATTLTTLGDSISERIDVRVPGYVYTK